ncbi:hypothetical protein VP01_1824g3 [Puccinia sorghi]|uniref:HeH/LEM domain-containing protein n=1 Tax=Puccinia sorghi TaxID=27349 RepID=A0A0L6VDX0_9BASI|nr:hypothetical protein VP01_1824g3 [Puccinia sorghi]
MPLRLPFIIHAEHLSSPLIKDPDGKIKKDELQVILKEFKIPFKAAKKKGALIDKYKLLITSEDKKRLAALKKSNAPNKHLMSTQLTKANHHLMIKQPQWCKAPTLPQKGKSLIPGSFISPAIQDLYCLPSTNWCSTLTNRDKISDPTIDNAPNSVIPDLPESWPTANWHRQDMDTNMPSSMILKDLHSLVASWLLDAFIASNNNDMDQDISISHGIPATQETPSQPIPMHLLMSTLNTIAQNSVQIGNTLVHTMNALAESLANLSGAIQSLHSSTTAEPFSALWYAGTLLQCSTPEDQRTWIQRHSSSDDSDSNSVSSQLDNMNLDEADPSFPYPNGPGHPEAAPETLKIIWCAMRKAGQLQPSYNWSNVESTHHSLKSFVIGILYNKPLKIMSRIIL